MKTSNPNKTFLMKRNILFALISLCLLLFSFDAPADDQYMPSHLDIVFKNEDGTISIKEYGSEQSKIFIDEPVEHFVVSNMLGMNLKGVVYQKERNLYYKMFGSGASAKLLPEPMDIRSFSSGDLNGDGMDDLVLSSDLGVWQLDTASDEWELLSPEIADLLTVGDLDNDKKADIVAVIKNSGMWIKSSSNSDGLWEKYEDVQQKDIETIHAIGSGDVTGDGIQDLLVSNASGVWAKSSEDGKWTRIINIPMDSLMCVDIDGDGIGDLTGLEHFAGSDRKGIWAQKSSTGEYLNIDDSIAADNYSIAQLNPFENAVYKDIGYEEVKNLPMMGGALHANFRRSELSHLHETTQIPFLFKKFTVKEFDCPFPNDPHSPSKCQEYVDLEETYRWGIIKIESLTVDSITLSLKQWDFNGSALPVLPSIELEADGNGYDIDQDGVQDLFYVSKLNPKRQHRDEIRYLRFFTSEELRQCFFYSYAPDLMPDQNKAGGNFGYNIKGNAIFREDYIGAQSFRSDSNTYHVPGAYDLGIVRGDHIISTTHLKPEFLTVAAVNYARNEILLVEKGKNTDDNKALSTGALEAIVVGKAGTGNVKTRQKQTAAQEQIFEEQNTYDVKKSTDEKQRFSNKEQYQKKWDESFRRFNGLDLNFMTTVKDVYWKIGSPASPFGRKATINLKEVSIGYGAELKVDIGFLKASATMVKGEIYRVDGNVEARLNHLARIQLAKLWDPQKLVPGTDHLIEIPLIAGIIPINMFLDAGAGQELHVSTEHNSFKVDFETFYYKESALELGVGFLYARKEHFIPYEDFDGYIKDVSNTWSKIPGARISFYTYGEIQIGFEILELLEISLMAELGIDNYYAMHSITPETYHIQNKIGSDFKVWVAARVQFEIPNIPLIGTIKLRKDFQLVDHTENIWEKILEDYLNPDLRPDLIISAVGTNPPFRPTKNTPVDIIVEVKNIGTIPILKNPGGKNNCKVKLYVDEPDTPPHHIQVLQLVDKNSEQILLEPGESYYTVAKNYWIANGRDVAFILDVDYDDKIGELDEENNTKRVEFGTSPYFPDLVITEMGFEPLGDNDPLPGDSIRLWAKVENIGKIASPRGSDIFVSFYLNGKFYGKGTLSGDEHHNPDNGLIDGLDVNESRKVYINLDEGTAETKIPLPNGTFYISAVVDPKNTIKEEKENNNYYKRTIEKLAPDLVVDHIDLSPESPTLSDTVELCLTITNQGFWSTPENQPFGVSMGATYSDTDGNVQNIALPAVFIKDKTGKPCSLSSGQSITVKSIEKIKIKKTGSYTFWAKVDAANRIAELDEDNNKLEITKNVQQGSDLVIKGLSLKKVNATPQNPFIDVGDECEVCVKVKNQGSSATTPGKNIDIRMIFNKTTILDFPVFGLTETNKSNKSEPSLGKGELVTACSPKTVRVKKGENTLHCIVDSKHKFVELNEKNNEEIKTITISKKWPDLQVTGVSLDPETHYAGDECALCATVKNTGTLATPEGVPVMVSIALNGNNPIELYANKKVYDNPKLDIHNVTYTAMGATDESVRICSKVKAKVKEGDNKISATIDPGNSIKELAENNNSRVEHRAINNKRPELRVAGIALHRDGKAVSAKELDVGDKCKVCAAIVNEGGTDTPAGVPVHVSATFNQKPVKSFIANAKLIHNPKFIEPDQIRYVPIKAGGPPVWVCGTELVTVREGDNKIFAEVDKPDKILELSNDNNSRKEKRTVRKKKPDLKVTGIYTNPANPKPGDSVVIEASVKNVGDKATDGKKSIAVRLLVDGKKVAHFFVRPQGSTKALVLEPGKTYLGKGNIKWKAKAGKHELKAIVDTQGHVDELNETNNAHCVSKTIESTKYPDLKVTKVWATPGKKEGGNKQRFKLHAKVKNVGETRTPLNKKIRLEFRIKGKGVVGTCTVENKKSKKPIQLKKNQTVQCDCTKEWLAPIGQHKLVVKADPKNQIKERREDNNSGDGLFIVKPDNKGPKKIPSLMP